MPGVKRLDLYYKRRNRYRPSFPCPRCRNPLTAKRFEVEHAPQCLNLDPTTHCVWCLGETSWPLHRRGQHANHLIHCFENFTQRLQTPPTLPSGRSSSPFILDLSPALCPARDLFGRAKLSFLPPVAYDLFCLLPLEPPPVPFQQENLNLAIACVRKYLELIQEGCEFFHCMVRAVTFPRFLQALEADQGQTRCLPFSCWCDGGTSPEARHRHHRHLILVSRPPKGRFHQDVWRHITLDPKDRPQQHFKALRKKPIQSPMHLVNALGYLSQRASRCNGCLDNRSSHPTAVHDNHFWILTSLPQRFRLPLVLQWDGGLLELITQDFRNTTADQLARAPSLHQVRGRWQLALRDLPGLPLGRVLSVAQDMTPTSTPTERALHLPGGRRLYFEQDASLAALDPQAWGQTQAERGNRFYEVVRDEPWTPCPLQQKSLHAIAPFLREVGQLKEALEKKEAENKQLRSRLENRSSWQPKTGRRETGEEEARRPVIHVQNVIEENGRMCHSVTVGRRRRSSLDETPYTRQEWKRKIKELETKNKLQETKMVRLEARNELQETKMVRLEATHELQETKMARLKSKVEQLEERIKQLETEKTEWEALKKG